MRAPATDRLKINPALGRMPTLQFCRPAELRIDPAYQRDIGNGPSQALIRRIAQHWNWDLCQPLVVARRAGIAGDRLFVIDGQHRLEAARLRRDIDQLPCVIVVYADQADEAASFVHLNQQRRPLSKIDLFKAAIASGDGQAGAIMAAITEAGLSLAHNTNYTTWKPGMLSNIGGIEAAWTRHGAAAVRAALRAMAGGFFGQVLRYAGTLFPGIAAVCAEEMKGGDGFADNAELFAMLTEMLGAQSQHDWRTEIQRHKGENPLLRFDAASAAVLTGAWRELLDAYFGDDEEEAA